MRSGEQQGKAAKVTNFSTSHYKSLVFILNNIVRDLGVVLLINQPASISNLKATLTVKMN